MSRSKSVVLQRWRDMAEGKEKYSAYLCSREWSVLKEQVRARSGGICERCTINPMDHVHHLTYERKYREELQDLQACCKPCHDFIHAKSDADPAADRPAVLPWCGRKVKTFYLAGKITGTHWRDEIVPEWSEENHSANYQQAFVDYDWDKSWCTVPCVTRVLNGIYLHYAGPWWRDVMGGHGTSYNSTSPHGYSCSYESQDSEGNPLPLQSREVAKRRDEVASAVAYAIAESDLFFAWIDSADCYGTLVEIGYAKALGKVVVVATSSDLPASIADEMWLAIEAGYRITAETPAAAWHEFWRLAQYEIDHKRTSKGAKDGTPDS